MEDNKEKRKLYQRNYMKEYKKKITRLYVDLYCNDNDIIDKLDEVISSDESKAAYVKRLIREDIERTKI